MYHSQAEKLGRAGAKSGGEFSGTFKIVPGGGIRGAVHRASRLREQPQHTAVSFGERSQRSF